MLGSGLHKHFCLFIRILAGIYTIGSGVLLLELCTIRYLYTTAWQNLRVTHNGFWKCFFRVFHICMFFWVGFVLSMSKLFKGVGVNYCANIRTEDQGSIFGDMVRLPYLFYESGDFNNITYMHRTDTVINMK